jgi:hypothetical protein
MRLDMKIIVLLCAPCVGTSVRGSSAGLDYTLCARSSKDVCT